VLFAFDNDLKALAAILASQAVSHEHVLETDISVCKCERVRKYMIERIGTRTRQRQKDKRRAEQR